jgi:hypothetical protein
MTPKHQQLLDATLLQVQERAALFERALSMLSMVRDAPAQASEKPSEKPSVETLRASMLGQRLRRIVEYVEGYPAEIEPERKKTSRGEERVTGGIRLEVYKVCFVLFGSAHEAERWAYPKHCQHTELGRLLHAALLQFYREYLPKDQLMSVVAAAEKIGIARQTLHEWMAEGRVKWVYEADRDVIWLDRDDVHVMWHKKRGLRPGSHVPEI